MQYAVNAVITGAMYSLMALGFGIIFNTTRIFHVAHAAVYTLAAFLFYGLVRDGWGYGWSGLAAVVAAVLAGCLMEWLIYRRLHRRRASTALQMVASLGIYFVLQNAVALVYGTSPQVVRAGPMPVFQVGGAAISSINLIAVLSALLILPMVHLFFQYTRYGIALRAMADSPELMTVLGIPLWQLRDLSFALGSALTAIGSVVNAFDTGVRPDLGFSILLVAAVAVIIGGIGDLSGAIVGGFVLGVLQTVTTALTSGGWEETVMFMVLLLFLLLRPQGILGGKIIVRRA